MLIYACTTCVKNLSQYEYFFYRIKKEFLILFFQKKDSEFLKFKI